MRPHCRVRRHGEAYGLDESMYIINFSRPGATLRGLGQKTWVSGWIKEWNLITILQVGIEDVLKGKEDFKKDNKLLLKMVRDVIKNLVEIKSEYF